MDGQKASYIFLGQIAAETENMSARNGKSLEGFKVLPMQIPRIRDDDSTILTGIDDL